MNSLALTPYFLQRGPVLTFLVESMNSFPSRFTESHTFQRPCQRSILDRSPKATDEAEKTAVLHRQERLLGAWTPRFSWVPNPEETCGG